MYYKILSMLFILGVLIPTSVNRNITSLFTMLGCFILLGVTIWLIYKQKQIPIFSLVIVLVTNSLLFVFTLFSSMSEYRFGTSIFFFILTLIFCLNFKNAPLEVNKYRKTLQIVNIIFIIFSASIMLEFQPIINFLHSWYSAFYIELLPNMFMQKKPVATFATHSIAGFYFFVFFLINFFTYIYMKKKSHLFSSIIFAFFLFNIKSSTALVYFLICFIVVMVFVYRRKKRLFFSTLGISLIFFIIKFESIGLFQMVSDKLFSNRNGLLIRYADGGVLADNINFILNNPFSGIGFGYSKLYTYVDSGFVEYALRGSVFVLISILIGYYLFLRRNLGSKLGIVIFLIYLSFEVGFSNLIYFRTLFILPFIVVYLSQLKAYNEEKGLV